MTRQDQEVSREGLGIQGGRDVVVNLGSTEEQFVKLMFEVGKQLAVFHAEGLQRVDERLSKFKDEVLKEFAKGTAADPEALKDPDFQAALSEAQKGFVRSSDEDVSASLINLITERSQLTGRSRTSLSLNTAIEVVAALTGEEIALLTAIFHSHRAVLQTSNPVHVIEYLRDHVGPQVSSIPNNVGGSVEYLISRGCLVQGAFSRGDYIDVIMREYATAFTDEFTLGELKAALPDLEATAVVPILEATGVKSLFGGGFNYTVNSNIQNVGSEPRFRFKGPSIERLISSLADVGLSSSGAAIEAFISNRKWEKDRVHSELVVASTALGQIAVTWINGGIGTCHLTSLGVAIAHSNARRLYPDFRAPLSVWVS